MKRLPNTFAAIILFCTISAFASAQTLTTLANFNGTNGSGSYSALAQGFDGNFYGTTERGGTSNGGTVFNVTPSGTLTTIYEFCSEANCSDGEYPRGGLAVGSDGNFYGTTQAGGAKRVGSAFKVTPLGNLTTLHSFCLREYCGEGDSPIAGLLLGRDGNFYGTTAYDGTGAYCEYGTCGTLFKITASGTLTGVYKFCSQLHCSDGGSPEATLLQDGDGSLYGTTAQGGANGLGTVFKIAHDGTLATLHSFDGLDGVFPSAGVVPGPGGSLYGTMGTGGTSDFCLEGCGTAYRITRQGVFATENFAGTNGVSPSGLIRATDGNFYGTTYYGGSGTQCDAEYNCGTIFRLNPQGQITTIYSFCVEAGCTDGFSPDAALVEGTDGNLYGTTSAGGTNNLGTVFVLNLGLAPFVETIPTSGNVHASVAILGTNLTGASSVSFNGTPASFTVVSSSEITTMVPTGATTGTVQVTTPGGALLSIVVFGVR